MCIVEKKSKHSKDEIGIIINFISFLRTHNYYFQNLKQILSLEVQYYGYIKNIIPRRGKQNVKSSCTIKTNSISVALCHI